MGLSVDRTNLSRCVFKVRKAAMKFNYGREKNSPRSGIESRFQRHSPRRTAATTARTMLPAVFAFCLGACAAVSAPPESPTAGSETIISGAAARASVAQSDNDIFRLTQLWEQRQRDEYFGDYPLGPGDVIEVNVAGMEEIKNLTERISGDGNLVLPFVGRVNATGMTDKALRAEIRRRLETDYMRNPQVNLFVKEYRSRQVAVIGAVHKPGLYNLASNAETILSMISQAGGVTGAAAERVLFIPAEPAEPDKAKAIIAAMPLQLLSRDPSPLILKNVEPFVISLNGVNVSGQERYLNMPARPGDIIMIPGAGEVLVQGWVEKPGAYRISSGLTLLGAVAAAGGTTFPADVAAVQLMRSDRVGQKTTLVANLEAIRSGEQADIALREGDVIDVVSTNTRLFAYGFYRFFTTLVHVGANASIPIR